MVEIEFGTPSATPGVPKDKLGACGSSVPMFWSCAGRNEKLGLILTMIGLRCTDPLDGALAWAGCACAYPLETGTKIGRRTKASGNPSGRSSGITSAVATNAACTVKESIAVQRRAGFSRMGSSPANMACAPQTVVLLRIKTPLAGCAQRYRKK